MSQSLSGGIDVLPGFGKSVCIFWCVFNVVSLKNFCRCLLCGKFSWGELVGFASCRCGHVLCSRGFRQGLKERLCLLPLVLYFPKKCKEQNVKNLFARETEGPTIYFSTLLISLRAEETIT